MGVKFVDYREKQIMVVDLNNVDQTYEAIVIGEKARQLVDLGKRNTLYIIYNVENFKVTKELFKSLMSLFKFKQHVDRRVIYGFDPQQEILYQLLAKYLGVTNNTLFAKDYTKALNVITEDEIWLAVFKDHSKDKIAPNENNIEVSKPLEFDEIWEMKLDES